MKTAFVLVGMLLVSGAVQAEMGCPPGLFPNTSGALGGACIPFNANVPQSPRVPQVRWADRWGALVFAKTSRSKHDASVLGVSQGMKSEAKAERQALAHCRDQGGIDCKLGMVFRNQCAAVVWGDYGHSSARAESVEEATRLGMEGCIAAGDSNCAPYFSACSFAERL